MLPPANPICRYLSIYIVVLFRFGSLFGLHPEVFPDICLGLTLP